MPLHNRNTSPFRQAEGLRPPLPNPSRPDSRHRRHLRYRQQIRDYRRRLLLRRRNPKSSLLRLHDRRRLPRSRHSDTVRRQGVTGSMPGRNVGRQELNRHDDGPRSLRQHP